MSDYFAVTGANYQDAYEKARKIYGADVQVTGHRTYSSGGFLGFFSKDVCELFGMILPRNHNAKKDFETKKNEILENIKAPAHSGVTEQQLMKAINTAMAENMQNLKQSLKEGPAPLPNQKKLEEILRENDFTPNYTKNLIEDLKRSLTVSDWNSMRTVEEAALLWIGKTIEVSPDQENGRPDVHVLVGPTGVGKTTTIAKLAFHLGNFQSKIGHKKLALINIDDYRVMAEMSLKKYGDIMHAPVFSPNKPEDLSRDVALSEDCDHILIDTAGRNPKDFTRLLENRQMLIAVPRKYECILTISAVTKTKDLETVVKQFESYEARDVIITKLDETSAVGNVISVLWEHSKRIRYITTGQVVPTDFSPASHIKLMQYLQGFSDDIMRGLSKETAHG